MNQYKPARWWFDFVLIYNKIAFVLLTVLLDSDDRAWHLLAALATLTTGTLVLVLIDKPFRDPELPEAGDVLTLADKLMIFSQVSQLLNYTIAAMCLSDERRRMAQDGSRGTSEVTGFIAAVSGFVLVSLQVLSLVYVYQKEQQEHEATERDHKVAHVEAGNERAFDNPIASNEDNDQEKGSRVA